MTNTHHRYLDGKKVNVPNKSKYLHFASDGSVINKPIYVKYSWFTEKNRRIVIAYLRNYRNGATLYAASILRTDLPTHSLYSKKCYHRHIATDRLYYYPVYIDTDVNVHQSVIEQQIRKSINKYGVCQRNCDYWDEDADYLFDNAKYMDIINPFTNNSTTKIKKIRKEIIDILPYNTEYIWYSTNNRKIICVYNVDRCNNTVNYAKCVFKPNKNEHLTTQQKLGHVKTAINRFIKKPITVSINVSTKKELHDYLKEIILSRNKSTTTMDSLQLLRTTDNREESSITDMSSTTTNSVASNIAVVDSFDIKYSYLQNISSSAECDSPKSTNSITINNQFILENKPSRISTRIKHKPKHFSP